jgi:hypothetical protein
MKKKKNKSGKGIAGGGKVEGNNKRSREQCAKHQPNGRLGKHSADDMITGLNRRGRRSEDEVISALKATDGMLTYSAMILGVSYNTLRKYVQGNAKVQEVLYEIEEHALDIAETNLQQIAEGGDLKAIIFFLKNKGKRRGFGDPGRQPMVPTQPITFKYKLVLPESYKQRNEENPSPSPEKDVTEEEDSSGEE